jgi:hypothetical protein
MESIPLVSLVGIPALSEEEAKKYQEKLLKRREYQREYMKKKRINDPEYVKASNASRNEKKKEKYKTDEQFREKEREYGRTYNATEREKMKIAKELYKNQFGVSL